MLSHIFFDQNRIYIRITVFLSLFTPFTAVLYHKSTVLSESLQYLHSCRQTFSLFLPVHMLHPGSDTHKMHVEMCLSSAKTDILL